MGDGSPLFLKGGDMMIEFGSLILMVTFATLVVAILSEQKSNHLMNA